MCIFSTSVHLPNRKCFSSTPEASSRPPDLRSVTLGESLTLSGHEFPVPGRWRDLAGDGLLFFSLARGAMGGEAAQTGPSAAVYSRYTASCLLLTQSALQVFAELNQVQQPCPKALKAQMPAPPGMRRLQGDQHKAPGSEFYDCTIKYV